MRDGDDGEDIEQELLEGIGRACGKLGHDFNNIFASLRGCVDLLQNKAKRLQDPTALDRELDIMRRALRKAEALTAEMRAFARPGDVDRVPVALDGLLGELQRRFSALDMKDFHLCVEGSCATPLLVHEPTILQMLLNLIMNAVDAMEKLPERTIVLCVEELEMTVGESRGLPPGRYCSLGLLDHGTGLSAEARGLKPFAKSRRVGVGKGLGLNLAMARLIMQKHGGGIELRSLPDVGTQVQLLFPLAAKEGTAPATSS